jgi:hypothetical protein
LCCDLPFCLHIIFLCMHMLKCINITAVLMFGWKHQFKIRQWIVAQFWVCS